MKKIISLILLFSILIFSCAFNTSALTDDVAENTSTSSAIEEEVMAKVQKEFDRIFEESGMVLYEPDCIKIWDYYCHYADENTIDYVYVEWSRALTSNAYTGKRYLDYCINATNIYRPTIGLYIYDVENEKVYTFEEAQESAREFLQDFLDNHRDEIGKYSYHVYICGDMDRNEELNVFDVALLQRALAKIDEFPQHDVLYGGAYEPIDPHERYYVSDYNYDGHRDIMDATAIQLKIAQIE